MKTFKKALACFLVVAMFLTAAPLSGFVGLQWPDLNLPKINFDNVFNKNAEAATTVKSGTCGSNLTWTLDDAGTLTISGTGEMENYNYWDNDSPWYSNCTSVKKIVIENGVTSIGDCAFQDCTSLTSVTIGDSVTSIGYRAFYGCTKLTSVTIPDSVTSIGNGAFYRCTSLTTVTIGDSVTSIGNDAFYNCDSLENIDIPDSVTSIGSSAFENCTSLASVDFGDNSQLRIIDTYTFKNCTSLTSVDFGDNSQLRIIDTYTFRNCTSLTSITIPDSVTIIGISAFSGCTALNEIIIDNNNQCYTAINGVLYNKDITKLIAYPSYASTSIFSIPDTVTSIGGYAFESSKYYNDSNNWLDDLLYIDNCLIAAKYDSGTTVTVDAATKIIADYAFSGSDIKSVTFGVNSQLKTIGDHTFNNCNNLTSITIPDNVTTIGNYAFNDCKALSSVIFNGTQKDWLNLFLTIVTQTTGNEPLYKAGVLFYNGETWSCVSCGSCGENAAYYLDSNGLLTIFGSGDMTEYHDTSNWSPWRNNNNIKKVIICQGITSISSFAFSGCDNLTSITIPGSVTTIGAYAFSGCSNLANISLPECTTRIETAAFKNTPIYTNADNWENGIFYISNILVEVNEDISECNIREGTKTINKYAFPYGLSLQSISIPDSVVRIAPGAFSNLPLESISVGENNTEFSVSDNVLYDKNKTILYCYPSQNQDSIFILPYSVTTISDYAFYNCDQITSITIPNSVTTIGKYAFSNCSNLTMIRFETNSQLSTISDYAFYNCDQITSITIPDSVTTIGKYAFSNCSNLTKVIFGQNSQLSTIGEYAFNNCSSLTDVYFLPGEEKWNAITAGSQETIFQNAEIHFDEYECEHRWDNGVVTTEPSATQAGKMEYTCVLCNTVKTKVLKKIKVIESGTCGDNLIYTLDNTGTLTISGQGKMSSYEETSFPWYANRTSIVSVVINEGVTSISHRAFYGCRNLQSVSLPDSLVNIGINAFYNIAKIGTYFNGGYYLGNHLIGQKSFFKGELTVRNGTKTIASYAFFRCEDLTSVYIPASVTHIGSSAFAESQSLTRVIIEENSQLLTIGSEAFKRSPVAEINLPDTLVEIQDYAFSECPLSLSFTIPASVTNIGFKVFTNTTPYNNINNWSNGVLYINNHLITTEGTLSGTYEIKEGTISIAATAFCDNTALTSVYIPESVEFISDAVFEDCPALTEINVDPENRNYSSLNGVLYNKEQSVLILYPAGKTNESFTIPDTVERIGAEVYDLANDITTEAQFSARLANDAMQLPGSSIVGDADGSSNMLIMPFAGNPYLIHVTIPRSVTYISDRAFESCDLLESVTFSQNSNLQHIGNNAFASCYALKSIVIPDSVKSIGTGLFNHCWDLTSVTLPKEITRIEDNMFESCSALTQFKIPATVTSIGKSAFEHCRSLTSITIPANVKSIGEEAFYYCNSLSFVDFGNNSKINTIAQSTFYNCSSLMQIIIPESVKTIEREAFALCSKLSNISFGTNSQLQTIGEEAFLNCSALAQISIPATVTNIASNSFNNTALYNNSANWQLNVLYIDDILLASKSTAAQVFIKDGTRIIAAEAFRSSKYINTLYMTDSVTYIGDYAFAYCSNLSTVDFGENSRLTHINSYAFSDCTSITDITIPDSVISIGERAFYWCTNLTNISLSDNLQYLGADAFYYTAYYDNEDKWETIKGNHKVLYIDEYLVNTNISSYNPPDLVIKDGTKLIAETIFYQELPTLRLPVSIISIESLAECSISTIYYAGSEASWRKVIGSDMLKHITVHCKESGNDIFTENDDVIVSDDEQQLYVLINKSVDELLLQAGADATLVDNKGNTITVTDKIGTGTVLTLANGTQYEIVVLGDTDGDGAITAGDARNALRHSVGLDLLEGAYLQAAEVGNDGTVSAGDAREILRASVGLDDPTVWFEKF